MEPMGRQCTSWPRRGKPTPRGAVGALLAVILTGGCNGEPDGWAWEVEGASTWYEVRLAGHLVGMEERVADGRGAVWRRRWQRFSVGGDVVDTVQQHVVSDHHPPPFDVLDGPAGSGLVGLPYGEAVDGRVVRSDRDVAVYWDGPSGGARFDDRGLVEGHLGALTWTRVATSPGRPATPLDVQALLAVPLPAVDRPRRRRVGRYRLDGQELRVEAPLDAELPRLPVGPRREDEPDIVDFVDRVVRATDVVGATRELASAVHGELAFAPTPGRSDGAGVLATGQGDCTEHTSLFLAAAHATGLDARPVAGLLYLSEGVVGPGLYPHAWAEVRVGERWVAVDPTLGTFPADAARVPLHGRIDAAMERRARGLEVELVELR